MKQPLTINEKELLGMPIDIRVDIENTIKEKYERVTALGVYELDIVLKEQSVHTTRVNTLTVMIACFAERHPNIKVTLTEIEAGMKNQPIPPGTPWCEIVIRSEKTLINKPDKTESNDDKPYKDGYEKFKPLDGDEWKNI